MFFQETTPDTSGYMIAGYAIAFLVMGIYILSLYLRRRNLDRDMEILEEMDKPSAAVESTQPKQKRRAKTVTNSSSKK